ncbi:MAG: phosphotransferase, partial [Caldilineales bacterium]|nr:phosphotransferase [Caldilineales bacterium]
PPATARPAPAPAARLAGIWQQLAAQNTEIADLTAIKNHFERVLAGRTWGDPVLLHGDLTLRNVLVQADGGVAVLDTDLALTGPAAYDLGFLDASLDFIDRWQVLSRGRLYDDAGLGLARMALRDGYDAGGAADDVALCRALRLLQRAAELGEHVQRTRPALARVLIPRLIHPYFLAAAARALGVG